MLDVDNIISVLKQQIEVIQKRINEIDNILTAMFEVEIIKTNKLIKYFEEYFK